MVRHFLQKRNMANLKVYFDLLSQPSRAIVLFLKVNSVPFTPYPVALRDGKHRTEEYAKNVSPFKMVPVIDDGGFRLSESVAILRYLCGKREELGIAEHWYPEEPKTRARIDEYLEWQHGNTRMNCAMYFQTKWLIPTMTGVPPKANAVEKRREAMETTLDQIEGIWLKDRQFIATTEKPSVADILAVCELEQPSMAGYNVYKDRRALSEWGDRVKEALAPHYDEVSSVAYWIRDKFKGRPASEL